MAASLDQLHSKANGYQSVFARMTAKEKEQKPSVSLCKDYNTLRALTLETIPQAKDVLPPEIDINEDSYGMPGCNESMAEIAIYVVQIDQLILHAMSGR